MPRQFVHFMYTFGIPQQAQRVAPQARLAMYVGFRKNQVFSKTVDMEKLFSLHLLGCHTGSLV